MFFRFLLVGTSGFIIDGGITALLVLQGIEPWLARLPAIASAISWTWLANRYLTYQVKQARSTNEALRYTLVASVMALLNYAMYLGLVRYRLPPLVAVTVASALQTWISFHAYHYFVFKNPH